MDTLLYIQASPRGRRSKSIAVADAFVESYKQSHPNDRINTLNVFETELITFDGLALEAKYNILHGQASTPEQLTAWKAVEKTIETFASASKYVLAVPMWNFSIPYRLKQYIDILVQPSYTFSYSPQQGYRGLLVGKQMAIVYARGGDYSSPEFEAFDLQKRYLETIMNFMGISDIRSIVVEPTLMGGPDVAAEKLQAATQRAEEMGGVF